MDTDHKHILSFHIKHVKLTYAWMVPQKED